jgi:hypothetical protein
MSDETSVQNDSQDDTHGFEVDLGIDTKLRVPDQVDDPLLSFLLGQVQSR